MASRTWDRLTLPDEQAEPDPPIEVPDPPIDPEDD